MESSTIQISEILTVKLGNKIGEGSFGKVYNCEEVPKSSKD